MSAKMYVVRNSDQPFGLRVNECELIDGTLKRLGYATLSEFDRIDVYVGYKGDKTVIRSYSTISPLPDNFKACSIISNSIVFTLLSEDTEEASKGDVFASIKLWKTGGRDDGEDLKEQINEIYIATIIDAFGSETDN